MCTEGLVDTAPLKVIAAIKRIINQFYRHERDSVLGIEMSAFENLRTKCTPEKTWYTAYQEIETELDSALTVEKYNDMPRT